MRSASSTEYYSCLQEIAERANKAIDAIYEDLERNQDHIRYIQVGNRDALAKQVKGLYDVGAMVGRSSMRSSECLNALALSGMCSWIKSFRDDRAIEESVDFIKRNSYYSSSETIDMIKEAARWSISSAAGNDERKKAFLETIAQGKGEEFLKDVLGEYQYKEGKIECRGTRGSEIGSGRYIEDIEDEVFRGALSGTASAKWGTPDYAEQLKRALNEIAEQLERDLDEADRNGDYITDDTKERLLAVVSELSRCGVSTTWLDRKVDKLAWFIGGNSERIREIQRELNVLLGKNIEEDGVYGPETEEAVERMETEILQRINTVLSNSTNLDSLDALCAACVASGLANKSSLQLIPAAILTKRKDIQRFIWLKVAVPILRNRELKLTADLLEHAVDGSSYNLHFSNSTWQAEKIRDSKAIDVAVRSEAQKIMQKGITAGEGSFTVDFYKFNETDMQLSIGLCDVQYTYLVKETAVEFFCTLSDDYDFDALRTIQEIDNRIVFKHGIADFANDAGLLSQADGVLHKYQFTISFYTSVLIG